MVYTNLIFNFELLLYDLKTCPVRIPVGKKIKKTDVWAPYGGLVSVQDKTTIRGVDTKAKKAKKPETQRPTQASCRPSFGKRTRTPGVKNIDHFLNQISVVLSLTGSPPIDKLGTLVDLDETRGGVQAYTGMPGSRRSRRSSGGNYHVHLMWFNTSIKIAGCRSVEDAVAAINILFEWYLKPLQLAGAPLGKSYYTIKGECQMTGDTLPKFVFDTAMKNVDFFLGFDVDREKVNKLFNGTIPIQTPEQLSRISTSQFETTEQKSVNMKMFATKPDNFTWLQYSPGAANELSRTSQLLHAEKTEQLFTSFLVFTSSKIILSGKYDEDMRSSYELLVRLMTENRHLIEERIDEVTIEEKDEFWQIVETGLQL